MGKKHGSGMLLLELMLAILIFSLAAAVCVQVFVKAHDLSGRAEDLTRSVNVCANAAEVLRGADSREAGLALLEQVYPQLQCRETSAEAVLDGGLLRLRWTAEEALEEYTISYLTEQGEEVYSLELVCLRKEALP